MYICNLFIYSIISNILTYYFSFLASKQVLLSHPSPKKDPEVLTKKKSGQPGQKSFKGRSGGGLTDTGMPLLEEEILNIPTLEENSSTPQQVH
jgi:hypothetical protein